MKINTHTPIISSLILLYYTHMIQIINKQVYMLNIAPDVLNTQLSAIISIGYFQILLIYYFE